MTLPRLSLSIVCMTAVLPAQTPTGTKAPASAKVPASTKAEATASAKVTVPVAAEQLLYRAYWLERVDRKPTEAVAAYRAFLGAAPKHPHAPRAAAYALGLLRRSGESAAADKFQEAFAAQLEQAPSGLENEGRNTRGGFGGRFGGGRGGFGRGQQGRRQQGRGLGFGRRGGFGRGAPSAEERAALEARIPQIEARIAEAKKAGDDRIVARYERILERVRGELSGSTSRGFGGRNRGQGGGAGSALQSAAQSLTARMPVRLPAMTAEQRTAFVTRYGKVAEELVASLKQAGRTVQATQLEVATKSIRKLIDEQKFAEAQAAIDALQQQIRNAR